MKTRGLIAGAFALALGLSASAEAWFDANISDYTEWPASASLAEGGAWSHTDGATLDTTATAKLVVDAEDDAALTFTATASKAIGDGVMINSTVTFNAFDSLPAVPEGAKAALIAVKDGDNNYNIYGLVQDGTDQANHWALLFEDQTDIEDVDVSINLVRANSATTVTYTFDGTPAAAQTVYTVDDASSIIQGAAFSGCGEVSALAAEYVVPKATINPYGGMHADYLYIKSVVDASGTEYWDSEAGNAKVPVGTEVKIYFAIDTTNVKKVIVGTDYITLTPDKAVPIDIDDTKIGDLDIQDAKAAIGTTYYVTFNAANDAAALEEDPVTITLLADLEIGAEPVEVSDNATVEIESGKAWKVWLTHEDSVFEYASETKEEFVKISAELELAGKILKYDPPRYFVGIEGIAFKIEMGDNVTAVTVEDDQGGTYTPDPVTGEIVVDLSKELNTLSFTVTASIQDPVVYSATKDGSEVTGSWEGNVFTTEEFGLEGGTFTFTVEPGQTGVTFTLTATGIEGTPTYKIDEADPVEFKAGEVANQWVATVPPAAVFTVGYEIDESQFEIPAAIWTTDLAHDGNVITMGEIDGAATLAITDAKDAPKDDPDAQKAAKDAIIASVEPEYRDAVTAQIAVLETNCSAKPSEIAGWIEENTFQGADLATAKAIDVSYDFGMNELFQEEAKAEVTAFAADAVADNTYVFEVQLMDGDDPRDVNKATEAAVAKIVQASSDVADFTTEAKKLPPTITDAAVSEGKLTFKVGLPTGAEKAFMRIAK